MLISEQLYNLNREISLGIALMRNWSQDDMIKINTRLGEIIKELREKEGEK